MLNEATLDELYKSTILTFPNTTKRQHSVNTVKITNLKWTPYEGVGTLLIRALAENEDKQYNLMMLFKQVRYHPEQTKNKALIPLKSVYGEHFFEKLSYDNQDLLLRCDCADYYWRMNFANYKTTPTTLYGTLRTKYESKGIFPPVNLTNSMGVCKHLLKLTEVLINSNIIKKAAF